MQNNFATTAQTVVNNCAKFCQQGLKTDGVIVTFWYWKL